MNNYPKFNFSYQVLHIEDAYIKHIYDHNITASNVLTMIKIRKVYLWKYFNEDKHKSKQSAKIMLHIAYVLLLW